MTQAGSYAEPFLTGSHLQAPGACAGSLNWALDAFRLMVDTMAAVFEQFELKRLSGESHSACEHMRRL
jgi:hypothetical protein